MEKIIVNGVTFTQKLGQGEKWTCRKGKLFIKIHDEGFGFWSITAHNKNENFSWYSDKAWKGLDKAIKFASKFDQKKYPN